MADLVDLCSSDEDNDDDKDRKMQASNVRARRFPGQVLKQHSNSAARGRGKVKSNVEIIDLVSESSSLNRAKRSARYMAESVVATPAKSGTAVDRVLEVFPDVEVKHAEKLLRDCKDNMEMVLSILTERSYPKSRAHASAARSSLGPSSILVKRNKVEPKFDFMAPSSFEPSYTYRQEAEKQLISEFPFVNIKGIRNFMKEHGHHYSIVRNRLLDALKEAGNASSDDKEVLQYQNLKPVWATKRPTRQQMKKIGINYCLKRTANQRRMPPPLTDPVLKEEVHYAKSQLKGWMFEVEKKVKRLEARKRSLSDGNGVECGCCFDRVPIEEMVACRNEGHLFCMECIESYANTAVFSNGSLGVVKATGKPSCELLCCDASGCQSGFHEEHLQKALSIQTLEKYNELQFRANTEAAGLSDEICTCPKCGFQADLPPNLIVFDCPVEDCRYSSCRKCGKEQHVPLRCNEVIQKTREDEGRLKVEEAITEAKIRKCPKCKTSFVKSDGCNKMTCRCGVKVCYICREQLTGSNPYTHFCQTAHCSHKRCGKCTLYSNAEQDDERAMREAGLTAAKAYREEVRVQESGAEVDIDVDGIISNVPKKLRRTVRRGR